MTVLIILLVLIVVAGIAFSIYWVREYALDRYDYKIEKGGAFYLIPIFLFAVSFAFVPDGENYLETVKHGNLDIIILLILSVISFVAIFVFVLKKTNLGVATFSSTILPPISIILLIAVIALAILVTTSEEEERKKKSERRIIFKK